MTILLLTGWVAGARAQKNSILVYGNAGYSSTNSTSNTDSYSFRPGVGYQFAAHLTAGLNAGVWGNKQEHAGLPGKYVRSHYFEAGPFLRYTQPLGGIFAIYGQCDVNYQHASMKDDITQAAATQNGVLSRVWPAIGVDLKNGFGLNFKFGEVSYAYSKMKGSGSSSAFLADFNWTTGFQFGISKNFSIPNR